MISQPHLYNNGVTTNKKNTFSSAAAPAAADYRVTSLTQNCA